MKLVEKLGVPLDAAALILARIRQPLADVGERLDVVRLNALVLEHGGPANKRRGSRRVLRHILIEVPQRVERPRHHLRVLMFQVRMLRHHERERVPLVARLMHRVDRLVRQHRATAESSAGRTVAERRVERSAVAEDRPQHAPLRAHRLHDPLLERLSRRGKRQRAERASRAHRSLAAKLRQQRLRCTRRHLLQAATDDQGSVG